MKLVRDTAANGAAVGLYRAKPETQPGKNTAVGVVHHLIGLIQRSLVDMEGVGIFHQEFTGTHHAETWPDFVTELGLNLVVIHWQLFITADLAACDISDDFFMRRAEAEFTLVTVMETQQLRSILLPASGFFPQFGRLHCGHQ